MLFSDELLREMYALNEYAPTRSVFRLANFFKNVSCVIIAQPVGGFSDHPNPEKVQEAIQYYENANTKDQDLSDDEDDKDVTS